MLNLFKILKIVLTIIRLFASQWNITIIINLEEQVTLLFPCLHSLQKWISTIVSINWLQDEIKLPFSANNSIKCSVHFALLMGGKSNNVTFNHLKYLEVHSCAILAVLTKWFCEYQSNYWLFLSSFYNLIYFKIVST